MRSCIYCGKTLEKNEKCSCALSQKSRAAKSGTDNSKNSAYSDQSTYTTYTTGYTKKEQKKKITFNFFSFKEYFKNPQKTIASQKFDIYQVIPIMTAELLILLLWCYFSFKSLFLAFLSIIGFCAIFLVFFAIDRVVLKQKSRFSDFLAKITYAWILPICLILSGSFFSIFSMATAFLLTVAGIFCFVVLLYEGLCSQWNFLSRSSVLYIEVFAFAFVGAVMFNVLR